MEFGRANFLRTGYYHRSNGYIHGRVMDGNWWSFAASSDVYGHYLTTIPTGINPQGNYVRGFGLALRCVGR